MAVFLIMVARMVARLTMRGAAHRWASTTSSYSLCAADQSSMSAMKTARDDQRTELAAGQRVQSTSRVHHSAHHDAYKSKIKI